MKKENNKQCGHIAKIVVPEGKLNAPEICPYSKFEFGQFICKRTGNKIPLELVDKFCHDNFRRCPYYQA